MRLRWSYVSGRGRTPRRDFRRPRGFPHGLARTAPDLRSLPPVRPLERQTEAPLTLDRRHQSRRGHPPLPRGERRPARTRPAGIAASRRHHDVPALRRQVGGFPEDGRREHKALRVVGDLYLAAFGNGSVEANSRENLGMHLNHFCRKFDDGFVLQGLTTSQLQDYLNTRVRREDMTHVPLSTTHGPPRSARPRPRTGSAPLDSERSARRVRPLLPQGESWQSAGGRRDCHSHHRGRRRLALRPDGPGVEVGGVAGLSRPPPPDNSGGGRGKKKKDS